MTDGVKNDTVIDVIKSIMWLSNASLLISIAFWLWIILKYDRFEREPLKTVVLMFLLGGLIRFAISKIQRYAEDGPFANRLFCHSCGAVNFPYERFCKQCGKKYEMEFYVFCPHCNSRISKNTAVCPKCGAEPGSGITCKR